MHNPQDSTLPMQRRVSRRSRPSLASLADSGFEPSRPTKLTKQHNTLPRSVITQNSSIGRRTARPPAGQLDLDVASQLLAENTSASATLRRTRPQSESFVTQRVYPPSVDEANGGVRDSGGNGTARFGRSLHNKTVNGLPRHGRASTISQSATISSAWSGVSNRLFLESVRGAGAEKLSNRFTEQFDKLAKKYGVQPFPRAHRANSAPIFALSAEASSTPGPNASTMAGNKFWNKLLRRNPSNVEVSKKHESPKKSLTYKQSGISDVAVIGKGKRDLLKGMRLEDMIRLGGVAIFNLPPGLAPDDLLVPTCVHAAANHILNHGLKAPGLFRVSGNINTAFALYDYFQRQLEDSNDETVVATTALPKLPSGIHYTVHDVAHLFKKLIHGLPGGLLGSPIVFQALYNVHAFMDPGPSLGEQTLRKVKARMIALAISSINLHFRISLICAVFGLLRAVQLALDDGPKSKAKEPHASGQAREDSLGTIFGPFLLGDKSQQIVIDDLEDRDGPFAHSTTNGVDEQGPEREKNKVKVGLGQAKTELEKVKRAAHVCQMLVDDWEHICHQLKKVDALNVTARAYDLPVKTREEYKYIEESEEPEVKTERRKASYGSKKKRASVKDVWNYEQPGSLRNSLPPVLPPVPLHDVGQLKEQVEDLIKFSRRNSMEAPTTDHNIAPLVSGRTLEMSPIAEMLTPAQSLQTTRGSESSPNWRILSDEPDTPIRRYNGPYTGATEAIPQHDVISVASSRHTSSGSSGSSTGPASPPSDITPMAARRGPAPVFESSPISPESVIVNRASRLSAPVEIIPSGSNIRRTISPVAETPRTSDEIIHDRDVSNHFVDFQLERPITPPPLTFRKRKQTSDFSIFEDEPETPRAVSKNVPKQILKESPAVTLHKQNSRSDMKLGHKATTKASPVRPFPESPSRSQTLPLQPATPNRRPRASTIESEFDLGESPSPGKKKGGNTALYAEIRRLQRLVDLKTEEAMSTKKELELAQNMAHAGTLSYIVRETQEELKVWKNRAEWAEKQLRNQAIIQSRAAAASANQYTGHAHRYSLS